MGVSKGAEACAVCSLRSGPSAAPGSAAPLQPAPVLTSRGLESARGTSESDRANQDAALAGHDRQAAGLALTQKRKRVKKGSGWFSITECPNEGRLDLVFS